MIIYRVVKRHIAAPVLVVEGMEAVAHVVDGTGGPQDETETGKVELPFTPFAHYVGDVFNPGFSFIIHFVCPHTSCRKGAIKGLMFIER